MTIRKCPYANVADCPLYHAMHAAGAPNCFSNRMDEGFCAVDLGKSYQAILSSLNATFPMIVAECKWSVIGVELRRTESYRPRNALAIAAALDKTQKKPPPTPS